MVQNCRGSEQEYGDHEAGQWDEATRATWATWRTRTGTRRDGRCRWSRWRRRIEFCRGNVFYIWRNSEHWRRRFERCRNRVSLKAPESTSTYPFQFSRSNGS